MRENAGYKIIKGILLPNCEFVLGEKQTASGTKYVTWRCVRLTDYYYGHYIESLDAATRDLYERAKEEIEFILLHTKEAENENKT
jgi:hypothetical protein